MSTFASSFATRPSALLGLSPLLLLCLAATWLVWGSTYLAIKLALTSFRRSSRWASASTAVTVVLAGVFLLLWRVRPT